jgi:recombinational DNA repair protein RecR
MSTGADEASRIAQLESDIDTLRRKLEEVERAAERLAGLAEGILECETCPFMGNCDQNVTCQEQLLDYAKQKGAGVG